MFIGGFGLQRPHSPVLGGILGNVVFCLNMATCSPYNVVFKYNTDDVVRISKVRGPFTKGYEQNYTHKFFTISERIPRTPPVYKLKDYDGDIIDGLFLMKKSCKKSKLARIKVSKWRGF